MLQRETVRFRQSDTAPNPLEVDYWIDLIANRYGGVIKYYDNLAQEWKRLIGLDGIIREVDPADYDNLGGFKLGYPENDHNYPVELDNEYRAYVNVPWTDTKYTLPPATTSKLGGVIVSTGLTVSSNGQLAVDSANVVTYWDNILNKPDYATRWPSWVEVTDKPKWHTVAYTGDYNDLFNLPDIEGMIADLVGSAPETLDTLKELADALGNDPNFSTTIMTLIGQKLDTSKYNQDKAILDQQISDLQNITEQHTEQIADNAEAIEGKQDELISGENIKTVNGESLLGPGNLQIRLFEVFSQDDLADGSTMPLARFNDLEDAVNRNWVIYIGPTDEGDQNEWIVCNEAKVTEIGIELTWNTTEAVNNDEVDYSVGVLLTDGNWYPYGAIPVDIQNDEVVGVTLTSGNRSWLIALDPYPCFFSGGKTGTEEELADLLTPGQWEAMADYDGESNTEQLMQYFTDPGWAISKCYNHEFANGAKGYLPALGELVTIMNNRSKLDELIVQFGGTPLEGTQTPTADDVWSSTISSVDRIADDAEYDTLQTVWIWNTWGHYRDGADVQGYRKARPVAHFNPSTVNTSNGGGISLRTDTVTIDRETRLVTHVDDSINFITSGDGNSYLSNDGTYRSPILVLDRTIDLANGNGTVTQTIADEISSAIAKDNLIIVTSDNGTFPLTARETDDTLEIEGLCLWRDSEYKTIQYYQYVIDKSTLAITTTVVDMPHFTEEGDGSRYLADNGQYNLIGHILYYGIDFIPDPGNGNQGTVTDKVIHAIDKLFEAAEPIMLLVDGSIMQVSRTRNDKTYAYLSFVAITSSSNSQNSTLEDIRLVTLTFAIDTVQKTYEYQDDELRLLKNGDGNEYLGDNGQYQNVSQADLVTYTKPSDWSAITANDSISEALGKLEVGIEQGNTKLDKITNYVTNIYPASSIGATDYDIYYDVYDVDDDNITVSSCLITAATTTRAGVMTASDKQLLNSLDSRVTSVEGSISSINSDITGIEGNITSIQEDITSIQGDITDIYDIIEGLEGGGGDPYVLPQATATTLGGIKIGYSDNGKYYGVQLDSNGNAYVYVPWTDSGGSGGDYELPIASTAQLGGIYFTSGDSDISQYYFDVNDDLYWDGRAYAHIPAATQSTPGAMSPEDKTKLDNMSSGGGGEGYVLPAATTTSLGGVMLGYPKTVYSDSTVYPLQLSQDDITADNRAFVSIPFATEEEGGLIKSEDKVYINTIQQSNPIVRIEEYYHSENFELRSYKVDETYSSTYIAACSITSAGVLRASSVNCLQTMTQSEYDDLGSYDSQTLYIIAD